MGSDGNGGQVYDLRRIEDVFACLEIISMARGALFGIDPGLARRMEKVSDALGAFSQLVMEGGLADLAEERDEEPAVAAAPETAPAAPGTKDAPRSDRQKADAGDGENGIIDILTGERIR